MHYQIEARARQEQLMSYMDLESDDIVVDLGCGTGYFVNLIHKKANLTIGIDIDNSALRLAKTFAADQEFIRADATRIPIKNRAVNKVLCTEVLEHVADDLALIKDCFRILDRSGIFVCSSPNADFLFRSKKSSHTGVGPQLHLRPGYSQERLEDLLSQSGFTKMSFAFALPLVGTLLVEVLERIYTAVYGPLKTQTDMQRLEQRGIFQTYKLLFPIFLLAIRIRFPRNLRGSILIARACRL